MKTNISMAFTGNCEEALNFYCEVFGVTLTSIVKYKDMPKNDNFKLSDEDANKVMHSVLSITDNVVIMATDDIMKTCTIGSNVGLSINLDNSEDLSKAEEIFNALAKDGKPIMPFGKTFWGAYYGSAVDKFGVRWEINYQL